MCGDVVDQVGLMVSCILHCDFSGFLELVVGCAKMGLKIYPILLKSIYPVTGFNCVLEFHHHVNNRVDNVGRLNQSVWGSIKFPLLYNIFDLVEECVNRGLWVLLH